MPPNIYEEGDITMDVPLFVNIGGTIF